ncbi:MAG TPA: hypothetical protein PLQ56_00110 [Aggregatilineales bacterium]|nr:hypothetical protein [Aggregatilineales bacterium]
MSVLYLNRSIRLLLFLAIASLSLLYLVASPQLQVDSSGHDEFNIISATDDPPRPPLAFRMLNYFPGDVDNIHWSPDSRYVLFEAPDYGYQTAFYEFAVDQSGMVPTLINLRAIQEMHTGLDGMLQASAVASMPGGTGLIQSSPDGRYLVFPAAEPRPQESYGYYMRLMDNDTGRSVLLPDITIDNLGDMNRGYKVNWNGNGTAFVIYRSTGFAAEDSYYIYGYATDLNAVSTMPLQGVDIQIDGQSFYASPGIVDLSFDGKLLILRGGLATGSPIQERLFLWDMENAADSRVVSTQRGFVNAAFSPDEQSIVYISADGLQQFDLVTGETIILDSQINWDWLYPANSTFFSLDRRRLLLTERKDSWSYFYVIDLEPR